MKSIWIEFPVVDIARASTFNSTVFGHPESEIIRDEARAITIIPGDPTVSLTQAVGYAPAPAGPLAYFDVDEPLASAIARVLAAHGSVAEEPNERQGFGFFAIVVDTEGNQLYLHGAAR